MWAITHLYTLVHTRMPPPLPPPQIHSSGLTRDVPYQNSAEGTHQLALCASCVILMCSNLGTGQGGMVPRIRALVMQAGNLGSGPGMGKSAPHSCPLISVCTSCSVSPPRPPPPPRILHTQFTHTHNNNNNTNNTTTNNNTFQLFKKETVACYKQGKLTSTQTLSQCLSVSSILCNIFPLQR